MKSNVKRAEACKVRVTVEIEPERVETRYEEVLKDFQKQAVLPGFRQGKAPFEMVEKKYGREAEEELLKSIIPEAYHQAVTAQKISPVSLPKISDIKMERGKKLTFTAELEEAPQFNLKNYKGIAISRHSSEVLEEDVEKGLLSLRESKAELVPIIEPRPIQKGDFISTDIEIWKDGQYVPGRKGALLLVEPNPQDDFYDKVVGSRVDEVREISTDPTEEEKRQGIVGRKPLYKFWIRGIHEKRLPDLDETFARIFGKETIEELRQQVHKDIAGMKRDESYGKMKEELFRRLLGLASFPLPESLVEKQKERLLEDTRRHYERMGVPAQRFEEEKAKLEPEAAKKAREQVTVYFILQKVADLEGIEADEALLESRLQQLGEESKRPLEEVRHVFQEDLRDSMREAKTIEFLLANAKLQEDTKGQKT
jgi:trigger factor